ncbi:MAG TPA: YlxR family protein [Dehalococcoidales bacterium]
MKNKTQKTPAKHVPQRTCVACRKTGVKRELVRLVRVPEGSVEVDLTGKKSGRGAYLCADAKCWETGLNAGRLEFALRTTIKPENKELLVNYAKGFDNDRGSDTSL